MVKQGADIFVIGAGSMAEAFIRGVTKGGVVAPNKIAVINKSRRNRMDEIVAQYSVRKASGWSEAANAGLIVLAVKPPDVTQALSATAPFLNGQPIVSFAAGISLAQLERDAQYRSFAVRTMPNLPVSVSAGLTAVTFNQHVDVDHRTFILHLLGQLGDTVEVTEDMMDAVTAFSGSGPGFLCYLLEAMESAATSMGFTPEVARQMLLQTLNGTIRTLDEWQLSPKELRQRVMSPGGTTSAGIQVLDRLGVQTAIGKALTAAKERSGELGKALSSH